jgi:alkylated DNA repair dioxygenase AlkB
MHDLFPQTRRLDMPGAEVTLHETPDLGATPDALFELLRDTSAWEQRSIFIHGKGEIPQPRLICWHGDAEYSYSNIRMTVNPWTPVLDEMRRRIEAITGAKFNSVLLNYYRDGRDSIAQHSDNEPELGRHPTIASVSLGAERIFDMTRKDGTCKPVHIPLGHGSLIVMSGDTQRNWKHGIAKTRDRVGGRINLTFRDTGPAKR